MGKPRCQVCGSRQWHKDPTSGLIACIEGHILQNYRPETDDAGNDFGNHALTKRKVKSHRKPKASGSRANPEFYHGLQGRLLYFKCLQLVLRHQILQLMKVWNLPPDYEIACREIWGLYLSLLSNPIPHEDEIASSYDNRPHLDPGQDSGEASATEKPDEANEELDTELDGLMRENSILSSSTDDSDNEETHPSRKSSHVPIVSRSETPASTITILIVACWVLRIPVMYRDFISLIESYTLPYLSLLKYIPEPLQEHLSKYLKATLQPLHPPRLAVLHRLAFQLCQKLQKFYSVSIPELNAAPILWRINRYMGGTPTLYVLNRRLAQVLDLPLTLAPELRQNGQAKFKTDSVAPEVSLLAAMIIVLKMVYGLDGRSRIPLDDGDPACSLPDFASYIQTLQQLEDIDCTEANKIYSSDPMKVSEVSNEVLDLYLDFCSHALIVGGESSRILDNYFPLEKSTATVSHVDPVDGLCRQPLSLRPGVAASIDEGKEELEPGAGYPIYKAEDVLGELTDEHDMIVHRGAKWLGVAAEDLNAVIESYERRLERWRNRRK